MVSVIALGAHLLNANLPLAFGQYIAGGGGTRRIGGGASMQMMTIAA